jgi:hypothetical protein
VPLNLATFDYTPITIALSVVFGIVGVWTAATGRRHVLVYLLAISLALGAFNLFGLGTTWSPTKLISTVMLADFCLRSWPRLPHARHRMAILGAFVVALAISLAAAFVFALPASDAPGLQSQAVRPFVQTYTYLSAIVAAPFAAVTLRTRVKLERAFAVLMYAAVGSSLIGLVQLALVYVGIPFMPILRITGRNSPMAAFSTGGHYIARLYAFAGEPKTLASLLLPALVIGLVAFTGRSRRDLPRWANPALTSLVGLVLILTFSTAAYLALAVSVPFIAVLALRFFPTRASRTASVATCAVGLFAATGHYIQPKAIVRNDDLDLSDVVYARSAGRVGDEWQSRHEYDAALFLAENPSALPVGLGPGMYVFHLPDMIDGRIISPIGSGWMAVILDVGLIGFGIILVWLLRLIAAAWRAAAAAKRRRDRDAVWLLVALIAALVSAASLYAGVSSPTLLTLIALLGGMLEAAMMSAKTERTPTAA